MVARSAYTVHVEQTVPTILSGMRMVVVVVVAKRQQPPRCSTASWISLGSKRSNSNAGPVVLAYGSIFDDFDVPDLA